MKTLVAASKSFISDNGWWVVVVTLLTIICMQMSAIGGLASSATANTTTSSRILEGYWSATNSPLQRIHPGYARSERGRVVVQQLMRVRDTCALYSDVDWLNVNYTQSMRGKDVHENEEDKGEEQDEGDEQDKETQRTTATTTATTTPVAAAAAATTTTISPTATATTTTPAAAATTAAVLVQRKDYMGDALCPVCGQVNGCGEYQLGPQGGRGRQGHHWQFPEGLLHLIQEHDVRPSSQFEAYLLSLPGQDLVLPKYVSAQQVLKANIGRIRAAISSTSYL